MSSRHATFRFYAELNDLLPRALRFVDFDHGFHGSPAIKDLIESLGVPHTEVELLLVNGERQGFEYHVQDGDRVSVYPMFESVDVGGEARVRPEPLRDPRFVLDVHLGKLTAHLRLLGFDCDYDAIREDEELARRSAVEKRILLTRDRQLLKRAVVTRGYCIRSLRPEEQAVEVLRRFDLVGMAAPFTRCLPCNGRLARAEPAEFAARIPEGVRASVRDLMRCEGCGRLYWKGTHYERLELRAGEILRLAGLPRD
jgi:uncharacterized protein with PIN domain